MKALEASVEQLTLADLLSRGPAAVTLPEVTRREVVVGMAEMIVTVALGMESVDEPRSPMGEVSRDD